MTLIDKRHTLTLTVKPETETNITISLQATCNNLLPKKNRHHYSGVKGLVSEAYFNVTLEFLGLGLGPWTQAC